MTPRPGLNIALKSRLVPGRQWAKDSGLGPQWLGLGDVRGRRPPASWSVEPGSALSAQGRALVAGPQGYSLLGTSNAHLRPGRSAERSVALGLSQLGPRKQEARAICRSTCYGSSEALGIKAPKIVALACSQGSPLGQRWEAPHPSLCVAAHVLQMPVGHQLKGPCASRRFRSSGPYSHHLTNLWGAPVVCWPPGC